MGDSEAAAIEQASRGDREAFRVLVEQHSRTVFRLAYRMTGNQQDAEDTVQETFRRAYRQIRPFDARSKFNTWIGYAVPAIAGRHQMCCCSAQPVKLESSPDLTVLFRIQQKSAGKIRTLSQDCDFDAGGLPLYWLTEVRPAESLALLSSFVNDRLADSAIAAIALHADPAADQLLERFVAASQPEAIRKKTACWLGAARGKRGYELLRQMLRDDPSERVRDKTVLALSISKEPEAVDAMIEAARQDKSSHVRGQALFWLA